MSHLGSRVTGADGNVLVIHLPPRFADEWINQIRREVEDRLPRIAGAGLVLDFTEVKLINSLGITCLLNLEERCKAQGAAMALGAVSPTTLDFLKRVKLDRKFTILPTVEDCVARFHVP